MQTMLNFFSRFSASSLALCVLMVLIVLPAVTKAEEISYDNFDVHQFQTS